MISLRAPTCRGPAPVIGAVLLVFLSVVAVGFALKAYAQPLEIGISTWLHDTFSSGIGWAVAVAVDDYILVAIIQILAVPVLFPGTRKLGICLIVSVAVVWVCSEFLVKYIVMRPRPYVYLDIPAPLSQRSDLSYYSAHTAVMFAIAGFLWKPLRRCAVPIAAFGAVVMVARIIAYAHYLSDVLVGAQVGFAAGYFFFLWASGELGIGWIPRLSIGQGPPPTMGQ